MLRMEEGLFEEGVEGVAQVQVAEVKEVTQFGDVKGGGRGDDGGGVLRGGGVDKGLCVVDPVALGGELARGGRGWRGELGYVSTETGIKSGHIAALQTGRGKSGGGCGFTAGSQTSGLGGTG